MSVIQTDLLLDMPLGGTPPDAPGGQFSLQLDDQPLPFRLRRTRSANVSLSVDEHGLQVRAPRGMSLPQIEQAIRDGSREIVGKLAGKTAGAGKLSLPVRWQDGTHFPFLGRDIALCLDGSRDGIELCENTLHLPLPPEAGEKQVKDGVQGWLQAQARQVFGAQLDIACRRLEMALPIWLLSFAAGSWGGVEPDGRLRLSWRLIHLTPDEIDSVVCRYLAQIKALSRAPELWEDDAASLSA